VFLGSGLLFLAALFVLAAMAGGIIFLYSAQANSGLSSDYYAFGSAIAHEILNTYMLKMAGVFMISTSTLLIRSRTISRWIAFVGYALAALLLIRISHADRLVWVSLAFPMWVLLVSIFILIDNYRRRPKGIPHPH
jgi:cell division protein FtsW (lipid II flippase)